MAQTLITLGEQEERFLNIYKAEKGIKNKNNAINQILKEYEKILQKDKEDRIFEKKVQETLKQHESQNTNKKFTKDEFLNEIRKW